MPVQLRFGPDDEDAFLAARDRLQERFDAWLAASGQPQDLGPEAELLLGLKWGYLDGDLAGWTVADLEEILLDLYPRKVMADPDLVAVTIPAAGAFLAFLDDQGLLSPGSDPLPVLLERLDALAAPFERAMGDTSRFGPSKAILQAMLDDGVDPGDQEAVQDWIDAFNAGDQAERERVLGPPPGPLDLPDIPSARLRPVQLAPRTELEDAARNAPVMIRLRGFVDAVRTPRKLTSRGNLTLADARELVTALGTGDRMDETIGGRTYRTRSSVELPTLDLTFRLARAAGLVKVRSGRVSSTRAGERMAEEPLESMDRALRGLLELGVLSHHYHDHRYGFGWYAEDVDGELPGVLLELYHLGPLDIEELAEELWAMLLEIYVLDDVPGSRLELHRELLADSVRRVFDRLAELGIVQVDGVEEVATSFGTDRHGGTVSLTPLGTWAVHQMATRAGLEAPVVGALAELDAAALLRRCADLAEDVAQAEIDAWVAQRAPEDAAVQIAGALRDADTVGTGLAFRALLRIGEPARTAVGALADDPALAPFATVWRVDALDVDAEDLATTDPDRQVAILHAVLELRGPHAVNAWLPLLVGGDARDGAGSGTSPSQDAASRIEAAVAGLWRSRTEQAAEVLDAIAATHDRKATAKAARKALFKLRSAGL